MKNGKFILIILFMEKGHLLEIHLLKKTARHQNFDCSTLFELMTKIYQSAQKSKKYAVHVLLSRCELQLLDKRFEKCQLLHSIFCKNGVHVWQICC
jgi:hypothetical protein